MDFERLDDTAREGGDRRTSPLLVIGGLLVCLVGLWLYLIDPNTAPLQEGELELQLLAEGLDHEVGYRFDLDELAQSVDREGEALTIGYSSIAPTQGPYGRPALTFRIEAEPGAQWQGYQARHTGRLALAHLVVLGKREPVGMLRIPPAPERELLVAGAGLGGDESFQRVQDLTSFGRTGQFPEEQP